MNAQLEQIINTPSPAFVANIRDLTRKEQSAKVRAAFKALGLTGISVTTPNYSMASSIQISLPRTDWETHEPIHTPLEAIERQKDEYNGMVQVCPVCKESWMAHVAIERIILAMFPDMDNRSDSQTDYSDFAFTIDS
jgi:hypothetical protein